MRGDQLSGWHLKPAERGGYYVMDGERAIALATTAVLAREVLANAERNTRTADEAVEIVDAGALNTLAVILWEDPDKFPSGADVCEALDRELRKTGRTPETVTLARWTTEARALGVEHAKNAASWCLDGNSDREERAKVLAMLRDGDPEAYDRLPTEPNLSGEFAEDLTPTTLAGKIVGAPFADEMPDDEGALVEKLGDAYEEGVRDTFTQECERLLIQFCEPALGDSDLDKFVSGYIACALWSSTDQTREDGGDPLDENYSARDFDADAMRETLEDCRDFTSSNAIALQAYCENIIGGGDDASSARSTTGRCIENAGHDFWLTRNGHGTGFWDRGLGDIGEQLSAAARVYGTVTLVPGCDGKLYI